MMEMDGQKIKFERGGDSVLASEKKRHWKNAGEWHAFSLILTAAVALCVISIIVYRDYTGVLIAVSIGCYIFYLFESVWLSSVARDLWLVKNQTTCTQLLKTLKNSSPSLHFRVQCYHHENTTVHVDNVKDKEDRLIRKRINTYSETDKFEYGSWIDDSDSILNLKQFGVVRLKVTKELHYIDRETEDAVKERFEELQDRNRNRDDQMDSETWIAVPGYSDAPPLCYSDNTPPCWMSFGVYLFFSIILLSWPYRILFETATGDMVYHVRKSISVHEELPEGMTIHAANLNIAASHGKWSLFFMILVIILLVVCLIVFLIWPRTPTLAVQVRMRGESKLTTGFVYNSKQSSGASVGGEDEFEAYFRQEVTIHNTHNWQSISLVNAKMNVGYTRSGESKMYILADASIDETKLSEITNNPVKGGKHETLGFNMLGKMLSGSEDASLGVRTLDMECASQTQSSVKAGVTFHTQLSVDVRLGLTKNFYSVAFPFQQVSGILCPLALSALNDAEKLKLKTDLVDKTAQFNQKSNLSDNIKPGGSVDKTAMLKSYNKYNIKKNNINKKNNIKNNNKNNNNNNKNIENDSTDDESDNNVKGFLE
eukprot:GHVR01078853.1.p1 GENE.GHVR01078853.1~~GHVR01078853.1.p1  ORF type:complete len:597 (+),score=129.70 GHVR01078853.1:101-1891(+)